jgi:hypothetical protein
MAESPDPSDRLSASLQAVVLQGREAWRLLKAAVGKLGAAGDLLGEAIILGLLAAQMGAPLLRSPAGLALLLAALGTLSPMTNGFGIDWLASSQMTLWAPVGVLPALMLGLWLFARSLVLLNREGKRDATRRQLERPQPGLRTQLARDARRRMEMNEPLRFKRNLPALEDSSFCHDIMVEALKRIRARLGNRDIALALERHVPDRGFTIQEVKGSLDPEVRMSLELGMVGGSDIDPLLEEALEDLQYRHKTIDFEIGSRRYLLLAVSGATIPDDVVAEISEATVLMLEEYVWALRDLDGEEGEA